MKRDSRLRVSEAPDERSVTKRSTSGAFAECTTGLGAPANHLP
jgi:hypothetical protein